MNDLTWGTRCAKDLFGQDNLGYPVKGLNDLCFVCHIPRTLNSVCVQANFMYVFVFHFTVIAHIITKYKMSYLHS